MKDLKHQYFEELIGQIKDNFSTKISDEKTFASSIYTVWKSKKVWNYLQPQTTRNMGNIYEIHIFR